MGRGTVVHTEGDPALPSGDRPTGGGKGTYGRRKFAPKKETARKSKPRKAGNLDDLQRVLDDDAAALMNMKQEMDHLRVREQETARTQLTMLRRAYDTIRCENEEQSAVLRALVDEKATQSRLLQSDAQARADTDQEAERLKAMIDQLDAEVSNAHTQQDVFGHMIRRLHFEIARNNESVSALTNAKREAENELRSNALTLRSARQETKDEELRLRKVSKEVAQRRREKEHKFSMIRALLSETSPVREGEDTADNQSAVGGTTQSMFASEAPKRDGRRKQHQPPALTAFQQARLNTLEEKMGRLCSVAGSEDVDEIIDKYMNRSTRNSQVQTLAGDVTSKVEDLKKEIETLKETLEGIETSAAGTASNRQLYLDYDMKDAALVSARRQCDDSKDRAQRLALSMEELRRGIARFLQKLTGADHSPPQNDHLPDAIVKLSDEVSRVIKQMSSTLVKSTDDHSTSSRAEEGGDAVVGEHERDTLTSLQLSSRLNRTLYHNLMTAEVDTSPRNLRITPREDPAQLMAQERARLVLTSTLDDESGIVSISGTDADGTGHDSDDSAGDDDQPSLDRETIKKLSKLVASRDATKGSRRRRRRRPTT